MTPSQISQASPSFDGGCNLAAAKDTFIHYEIASRLYGDNSRHGCSSPPVLLNRHRNDGECEQAVLLNLHSNDGECEGDLRPGFSLPKREDQDRVAAFSKELPTTYGEEAVLLNRQSNDGECEEVHSADLLPKREDPNRVAAFPQEVPPTYGAEEQRRHEERTCKPCMYFTIKEDGCHLGDNCTFCHICTQDDTKDMKRLLKRQRRAARRAQKQSEAEAYQTEDLWMWPDTWQASSLSLCTPITQSL
eukprot:TRINITY_DN314_c0_g5_i1.p1 TRINITY_DN314_c0_g5~~TRINITY_DN314_c0_g5_i1.p1  ORF type:complete len:247 (+),score=30.78 TRINITY_DN314_c0_g5_i1:264-1004(+)